MLRVVGVRDVINLSIRTLSQQRPYTPVFKVKLMHRLRIFATKVIFDPQEINQRHAPITLLATLDEKAIERYALGGISLPV